MNSEHKVVTFAAEGYWDQPTDKFLYNPDTDDQWIETGFWRVRTYEGVVLFRDKNIQLGLNFLNDNHYAACPDGEHFQKVDLKSGFRVS